MNSTYEEKLKQQLAWLFPWLKTVPGLLILSPISSSKYGTINPKLGHIFTLLK
jgi:hypothetical protein